MKENGIDNGVDKWIDKGGVTVIIVTIITTA